MRKTLVVLASVSIVAIASGYVGRAQAPAPAQGRGGAAAPAPARGAAPARPQAVFPLADNFLDWRLLPSEQQYASIDGKKMLGYVKDLAAVSDRYRDAGHPQFWGRIIGSSADREDAAWLMAKYKEIGLQDVHEEMIDLTPQWFPQSWDLTATSGDKTLKLTTAQPAYSTPGTKGAVDLEVVYVGLGSEADLIGRDLHGKAVLIFSNPMPGSWRHTSTQESVTTDEGQRATLLQLAERRGAAAIICSLQLPPVVGVGGNAGEGNIRTQLYPTNTTVPTFSMGMKDGKDLRDMVAHAPSGQPVHLKLAMDVQQVPNLKTSTVWGKLPGTTNEVIYVEAHRDGWFESATDNASGVATQLGIAEYFAKIPQSQRRRTIVFLGTSGHHNSGTNSAAWLNEHHEEIFKNAALLINCEHTAAVGQELLGEGIRVVNAEAGFLWYGGGNQRPKLQTAAYKAFQEFGVPIYAEPEPSTPGGEASRLAPWVAAVQASNYNMFFHSDAETPAMVPAPGLAASARAYAKVIEEVNKMDLKELQPPAPAAGAARGRQ
ncbi:MAG TPA: M28 family peptidase [Vicinamibacterales bacterium]|nr:M28 family peptidase [Vicinamibacterales bacterium]